MKTVFSDLSLDVNIEDVEALKKMAPALDDQFIVQTVILGIANRESREGYREVICQLTPKISDPVVFVHAVIKGLYDGVGQDLQMFSAVDNRIGTFSSTPSSLTLIASYFLGLPDSKNIQSYVGRIIDHCLKLIPEHLVYELAVKHELPEGDSFWLIAPYLSTPHRLQMLTEVHNMEKAWWLIRNSGGLTHLAGATGAVKDKRVRAAIDSYIHSSTLEE